MADVFRFPDQPKPPPPKNTHRATFFTIIGPSSRPLTCAAFDVETGLEVRLFYEPDDLQGSQLFRGPLREDEAAGLADRWRLALLEKGFTEVATACELRARADSQVTSATRGRCGLSTRQSSDPVVGRRTRNHFTIVASVNPRLD